MKKRVLVNDKMQKGYEYFLTEAIGKNFDKNFKPDLSPKQMLELGVFGGVYMRDCTKEFPNDWFVNAKLQDEKIKKQNPIKLTCTSGLLVLMRMLTRYLSGKRN
jgi:hypothetical protein